MDWVWSVSWLGWLTSTRSAPHAYTPVSWAVASLKSVKFGGNGFVHRVARLMNEWLHFDLDAVYVSKVTAIISDFA